MSAGERTDIIKLFREKSVVHVSAPMVRYSKLEFRSLIRKYGVDLCFTPMIMADSFIQSIKARNNEFSTNRGDTPLVVQFAANSPNNFVAAAELISQYSDGVDLNCGCPQRWAMQDGYGAAMLHKPELIKDIISQVRNRIRQDFTVSVKVRLLDKLSKSVELCRTIEAAGASFLTIHGRTVTQRSEPVDICAIKNIASSVRIPVIANGGVKTLEDVRLISSTTNTQGVMAAQGLLTNPALFSGAARTPLSCVQDWVNEAVASDVQFQCLHHHLVFMLEKVIPKEMKKIFNNLPNKETVLNFLEEHLQIKVSEKDRINYLNKSVIMYDDCKQGKFFKNKIVLDKQKHNLIDSETFLEDSFLGI